MPAAFHAVPVVRAGGLRWRWAVLVVAAACGLGLTAARAAVDSSPGGVTPPAAAAQGATATAATPPGAVIAQATSARQPAPAPTDNDPPGEGLGVLAASLAAAVWVIGQRLR